MKTSFQLIFTFMVIAASPAWGHSVCQYINNETQCSQSSECAWEPDANGSGQCVYEKGFLEFLGQTLEEGMVNAVGTADSFSGAEANALQGAEDRCHSLATRISEWKERWVYEYKPGHIEINYAEAHAEFACQDEGNTK